MYSGTVWSLWLIRDLFNSLPVFLFTFVIYICRRLLVLLQYHRLKYRVNFFILGNSLRLNILILRVKTDQLEC